MPVPFRTLTLATGIGCIAAVLTAAYIEPFASMNPCPMCMMQRALYLLSGVLAILCFFTFRKIWIRRAFSTAAALTSLGGLSVAARQVWLQHLPPDEVPPCGPGIEYMMDVFPFLEVIQMSLMGTGDCAEVQWQWLGLSIPGWSILLFAAATLSMLLVTFARAAQGQGHTKAQK